MYSRLLLFSLAVFTSGALAQGNFNYSEYLRERRPFEDGTCTNSTWPALEGKNVTLGEYDGIAELDFNEVTCKYLYLTKLVGDLQRNLQARELLLTENGIPYEDSRLYYSAVGTTYYTQKKLQSYWKKGCDACRYYWTPRRDWCAGN